MKKGFTPKMKFRIDSDTSDAEWCKPVSEAQLAQIQQYFEEHPKDAQRFQQAPFVDRPAVSTGWLRLTPEQVLQFQQVIAELPTRFTKAQSREIFARRGLLSCFGPPPGNYAFQCWPSGSLTRRITLSIRNQHWFQFRRNRSVAQRRME